MLHRLFFTWNFLVTGFLWAQTTIGPIPMPSSGYGSWGSNAVDSIEFYNSVDPVNDTSVIYFPQGTSTPLPTVFFLHGAGGNTTVFERDLFHFVASKGFACVFVPWSNTMSVIQAYSVMYNGFLQAGRTYTNIIDTSRIGFVGHSVGGGACYSLAYSLSSQNWGTNALFLMPVAQWYTHAITQSELQSFPSNAYLLSIVYDDDVVCDHRMAIDIFRNISIASADKDIVMVTSSQYQSWSYNANHAAFQTTGCDALDVYVTFRLLDAMMDFVFNQNALAKTECLGDGSAAQVTMPTGLNPLLVSDTLSAWHPEANYYYACSDMGNPRWGYCDIPSGSFTATTHNEIYLEETSSTLCIVNANPGSEFEIVDARGAIVIGGHTESSRHPIPTSILSPGIYVLRCGRDIFRFSKL